MPAAAAFPKLIIGYLSGLKRHEKGFQVQVEMVCCVLSANTPHPEVVDSIPSQDRE